MIEFKDIKSEQELKSVLEMCYRILGTDNEDLYGYEAWLSRLKDGLQPLLYACDGDKIISAVLGRSENKDSLVIGFVACDENYRRQGITKMLMELFEAKAKETGYKYITLGSKEDSFYEKCGYRVIFEMNGQSIYQKVL
ncbi:MAG: GNAT family N-acetyltransferase [Clostridia bacterium]|nr:GNAT family N-acetyltransferase [Clostridia bacterium]